MNLGKLQQVPTARQGSYETAAAINAMPVWARSGRSLSLPLRYRVRVVSVPALEVDVLVAAAGTPRLTAGLTRPNAPVAGRLRP